MTAIVSLPEILNIPPKLHRVLFDFNKFRYFLLSGGRGSGKSHTIGRIILYVAEQRKVRVVCGREIQANLEESVYTLLKDMIEAYGLNFTVFANKIVHNITGSVITFKGFRDQGKISIKGLEGVDILWIDEAQSITAETLKVIIPTIRKNNAKIFFTMNRFMRDDAVPEFLMGRKDCCDIEINYFDNPHCPLSLKIEAEECKTKNIKDYNHIWLNMPLASADDYLFDGEQLYQSIGRLPFGDIFGRQRVVAFDFAAQGNDMCVGTCLDRLSNQHWGIAERIPWNDPNTMYSTGKIIALLGQWKPDVALIDIGGMGKPVWDRLSEQGVNILPFDGGSTDGVDTRYHANIRAKSYFTTKDWFDQGFLCISETHREVIKELEKIKFKYRSTGCRVLESKVDMKKELKFSPDNADSLNMAIWAAVTYLGKGANSAAVQSAINRVTTSRRNR